MKKIHIAAALALTSCMVIGAAAVSATPQNVTATFRPDVTVQVNGTDYVIRDTNGARVAPLIYNGTTYLPLSTMGQILGVQVSWDAATQTVVVTDQGGPSTTSGLIGEDRARQIALNHAGISAGQANFLWVKLDWDDGRQVYEVEFYSGNTEYDYEIDASTGEIRSYDFDIENYAIPSAGTGSGTGTTGLISETRAQEIALNHAGVSASQASFVRAKLDRDDGRQVYDVDFYSGNTEYDYEIDAVTGEIRSYDHDIENYTIPSGSASGDYITQEQARQLAQDRAPNATLYGLHFEYDDGRAVYEGTLREGRMEYEFTIDAVTGSFLQWEQDWDD